MKKTTDIRKVMAVLEMYGLSKVIKKASLRCLNIVPANFYNNLIGAFYNVSGRVSVAHHGIQRSGTNYLNCCLKSLGVYSLNSFDPLRNHPRHKHFRWQENKASIMPYDTGYLNTEIAKSVFEVNEIARYPADCKHIVINKDIRSWMVSILNHGLRCDWFETKFDALNNFEIVRNDYNNYYDFWSHLSKTNPAYVQVIELSELAENPLMALDACNCLSLRIHNEESFTGKFDEIPMSPLNRKKIITVEDVEELF